jgi:hypothetical protein
VFGVKRPTLQPGKDGAADGDPAGSTGSTAAGSTSGGAPDGGANDATGGRGGSGGPGRGGSGGPGRGGSGGPPGRGGGRARLPGSKVIAIGAAAVCVVTAAIVYAATQTSPTSAATSSQQTSAASPIHVVSISPASQASGVDGANPITVTFSGPVSADTAKPKLSPSVPGTWTAVGTTLQFMPTTPFSASTQVTIKVPAGRSGVHSTAGGLLSSAVTSQFTTAPYSQAGLAVLLAKLGYLPLTWDPMNGFAGTAADQAADPAAETPQGEAYQPPPGIFQWQPGYPPSLQADWSPDQANVILQGAVMAFDSEHNMTINGDLTPQVWNALFQAEASNQQNVNGYTYAIASKGSPETLTIWHNGQVVLTSLANTGIGVAPTVDGTFPVYERFLNTIMSGTNPDGSHYSDPVQFVSYFNGGDAVHYFARGSYGYPQSLGCVELPYNDAQQAYPYLTYGSLVSVQG